MTRVLLRLCAVATAVKINPVSQVIGLLQDLRQTQVLVKAFNTNAKWCSDQVKVDGYQQEILEPAPGAPTPAVYAAPAHVAEYIVFYAAAAQVVEYVAAVLSAYAAPVVNATVGFASLLVKPIVSDDDSCVYCERHVHASIAPTNAAVVIFAAKAETAIADISSLSS